MYLSKNPDMIKHLLAGLLFCLCLSACANKKAVSNEYCTFILVRHAEKVKNTRDPGLTAEGKDRAYFLAEYLKGENLTAVYSTDYFRTRKTAQPTVSLNNLKMNIYDAEDLRSFSAMLLEKHKIGAVLVVGHSNTTPILANHLIGEDKYDFLDEWQYDQIYFVQVSLDGTSEVKVKSFGKKSIAP